MYIIILPGFGIVSHVINNITNKPIFGQIGPSLKMLHQTICRKLNLNKLNTINIWLIVKILIFISNPQITKTQCINYIKFRYIIYFSKLSMWVGISETIRLILFKRFRGNIPNINSLAKNSKFDLKFNQWLAGLIDGKGSLLITKKYNVSLEITMNYKNKHLLNQIKQKFGGSIKLVSGYNSIIYRLHHYKGIISLLNAINGKIRNPKKLIILNKILNFYNIKSLNLEDLDFFNPWFSGYFDGKGNIVLNNKSNQIFIKFINDDKYFLEILKNLYGGNIYISNNSYLFIIYKKKDILNIYNYFKLNPSRSFKKNRLFLILSYFELKLNKAHLVKGSKSILAKKWIYFQSKWNSYEE